MDLKGELGRRRCSAFVDRYHLTLFAIAEVYGIGSLASARMIVGSHVRI